MTFDSIRFRMRPIRAGLAAQLQSSLLRNGYALVLNSMATSALGVLYWMLAARYYPAQVVGINAALINAMLFLAQSAQLNLTNGVNRFLPVAGQRSTRFIVSVYAVSLGAVPMVCLLYFTGLRLWAPSLYALFAERQVALFFVAATMAWCIFAMQDSVLVGLRQATWIPLENLLFGITKLLLLVGLVTVAPALGIFISWVIPMVLLLVPVNFIIFRQLTPHHVKTTQVQSEPLHVGTVTRYIAGDYLGTLVMSATTGLLPLLVLEQAGAATSAYFSIAWTIANSLYLVSRNMGMSLVSEGSLDRDKLGIYSWRILVQTYKLLLPITLLVVLAAPWLLRLFGQAYSSEATQLLRLLALSALPAVIPALYISVGRVQRRLRAILVVQVLLSTLLFGLSYLLLQQSDITGIGLAWLIGQSAMAVALFLYDLLAGESIRSRLSLQLASDVRRRLIYWQARYRLLRLQPVIHHMLETLCRQSHDQDWQPHEIVPTSGDSLVLVLRQANGQGRGMLKLPLNPGAVRYSQQQEQTLTALRANSALGAWRGLLPSLLLVSSNESQPYVVESFATGVTMQTVLAKSSAQETEQLLHAAAEAISVLHHVTSRPTIIDERLFTSWVRQPVEQLKTLYSGESGRSQRQCLEKITQTLHNQLLGKPLAVGWTHGDFAPCNILVAEDGSAITGLVDWEQSLTHDLPILDLLFLLLTARLQREDCELGSVVEQLLTSHCWSAPEQALLTAAQKQLPGEVLATHTLLLLTWLRHVSMTVDKSLHYRNNFLWRRSNVDRVLTCLEFRSLSDDFPTKYQ